MDMRTPLAKVRGLGSAKDGTEHFVRQRLTAVSNIVLLSFFVVFLVLYAGAPHRELVAVLHNPLVAIVCALVIVSATVHMRIGMQVIVEDYVHAEIGKIALLFLNTFFATIVAGASLFALLKIAFVG